MKREIERRWTLPSFEGPARLNVIVCPISTMMVYHWYIKCTDNFQLRIGAHVLTCRSHDDPTEAYPVVFTFNTKKGSGMSRNEGEFNMTIGQFNALIDMCSCPGNPIKKDYRFYQCDGFEFEVCRVDDSFNLVEVEFNSEEEAKNFDMSKYYSNATEVTDDPHYMMKNYWKETREKND